jgi:hypothetical protein
MLRFPHCLDNRLRDSGKVVCPTHQPHFSPQKHYFLCFCELLLLLLLLLPSSSLSSSSLKVAIFWDIVPCSPYMNQCFGGTLIHIRNKRRYITEDGNLHNYRCENFTSYITIIITTLIVHIKMYDRRYTLFSILINF